MASFLKRVTSKGDVPSLNVPKDKDDEERSRSRSRARSLSPFRRKDKSKSRQRDPSAEGLRRDVGMESGDESDSAPVVCPSNAFDSEDSEDDEEWEEDEELERNTEVSSDLLCYSSGFNRTLTANPLPPHASTHDRSASPAAALLQANASFKTPLDFIEKEGLDMVYPGEGPNLLSQPPVVPPGPTPLRRKATKSNKVEPLVLNAGRPVYEKNRCTVVLTHGDPDKVGAGRRRRRYLVASDLSEESLYAIEVSWLLLSAGLHARLSSVQRLIFPRLGSLAVGYWHCVARRRRVPSRQCNGDGHQVYVAPLLTPIALPLANLAPHFRSTHSRLGRCQPFFLGQKGQDRQSARASSQRSHAQSAR